MAKPVQTKDMPIPIPCLQLCPVFFSIFFFYFLLLLQHQAWVWHSPPPPTHYAHPRAHAGSVPSSCDTELSHWGWAEPGITLLLSLVHLSACSSPHPEPTLCLPYTHKCPCWQSPLAEGAKGGQLCAKPVVVHPGLPLSSTKNPPALQSGWALHMVPLPRAPGCLCPCVHLYRSGQWMVPAGWVSHYCVLFCFSPCVEELLQEWKKVQETGGGGRREGHQKTNNADVPRVHRQKPKPGGCKETRERCENRTSVRDTSPCTPRYYPTRDTMAVSVPGWARCPTPAKQLANFTESSLITRLRWTYLEIVVSAFPADRGKLCDLHMSELEPSGKPWPALELWMLRTGLPLEGNTQVKWQIEM